MSSENIVKLNIGGTVFQTTRSTLTKFDGMFRTIMETSVPLTKDDSGCIFIDRDPKHFRLILNFIRDGHVALPSSEEDREEIIKEAQYYLLDDLMKLFDSKKPAVIQCKNHFLENHDQLVDAFVRCTKKGTIVVTHCQEKNSYAAARMSLIINEYDKDFDVYFLAETCHSIPRPIEKWCVEIFDRSTKQFHSTWVGKLHSVIKNINTVNH